MTGKKVLISEEDAYHWKDKIPFPNNWAKQYYLELNCRSKSCAVNIEYSLPACSINI